MKSQSRGNYILSKMQQREHELHQKRLSQINGCYRSFDNAKPHTPKFLATNPKRQVQEAERELKIIKDNNNLLHKMQIINHFPGKLDRDTIENTLPYSHGTLNEIVRNRTNRKINDVNVKILDKIQQAGTHYPVKKIVDEATSQQNIRQSIIENSNRFEKNLYFLNTSSQHTSQAIGKGVRYYTFENDLDTLGNSGIKGVAMKGQRIHSTIQHGNHGSSTLNLNNHSRISLNNSQASTKRKKRPASSYQR